MPRSKPTGVSEIRRTPRWIGQHIALYDDGTWEWVNCVRCGEPLRSKRAKENGYGPGCAEHISLDLVEATQRKEREAARLAIVRRDPRPARGLNSRHRRSLRRTAGEKRPATERQIAYYKHLCAKLGWQYALPYSSADARRRISSAKAALEKKRGPQMVQQ